MGVSLVSSGRSFPIGSAQFLRSFFSTVYVRLEQGNWGSRFPVLMRELYSGSLVDARVGQAREELKMIRSELGSFKPTDAVWDYENLAARPPWGDNIAPTITSLANYFWTADGEPLLDVLDTALRWAQERGAGVTIQ